nr:MAG TPA: hypothetical protein [Caudoviricetes sp.]
MTLLTFLDFKRNLILKFNFQIKLKMALSYFPL